MIELLMNEKPLTAPGSSKTGRAPRPDDGEPRANKKPGRETGFEGTRQTRG